MDITPEAALQELASRLVEREVIYCVSGLISTLSAREWDGSDGIDPDELYAVNFKEPDADNYREAAEYADDEELRSLKVEELATGGFVWSLIGDDSISDPFPKAVDAWRAAFADLGTDQPAGDEVYEHWIVSDWLAEQLRARGEAVSNDISGLVVWGRTTTGQAISMDSVIRDITRALHTGKEC